MNRAEEQRASPIRSIFATLLIVLFSVTSAGRALYERQFRQDEVPHDRESIEDFGRRVALLQNQLPTRGTIGFLCDTGGASREYVLAQYFLAPLIVQYGPFERVVVGYYSDEDEAARFLAGDLKWPFPPVSERLRVPPVGTSDSATAGDEQ